MNYNLSRLIFAFALIGTSFFCVSAEQEELEKNLVSNSVVKVISILHPTDNRTEGSGLLLRYKNRPYVLTSDHVLIHDLKAQHAVKNPLLKIRAAKMVTSDWGRGLALLEVLDFDSKNLFFEFVDEEPVFQGSRIQASREWIDFKKKIIAGYPFGSQELRTEKPQIPIELVYGDPFPSKVHPLAKVLHVNMSAEYGMSGGVYLHNQIYLWGVLSYLQSLLPGLSPDVFAIDRETIEDFLRRTFAGIKPECEQKLSDQVLGKIPACGEALIAQVKAPHPWKLLELKWHTLLNSLFYSFQWAKSYSANVIVKTGFGREVENFHTNFTHDIESYLTDSLRAKQDAETCGKFLETIKQEASGDMGIKPFYDSLQSIQGFLQEIVPLNKFHRPPNY